MPMGPPSDSKAPDRGRKHGPKLSGEEYDHRIVALYADGPALPDHEETARLRRAEFDLLIDHRLGTGFPVARRERLWAAQRRLDRRRVWHLLRGWLARDDDQSAPMTRALLRAYAEVLHEEELVEFFDLPLAKVRGVIQP